MSTIQDQHTAGPIAIGFDYQFYYFMYLALELKHGQKIGFEVKDDVHIDREDGTTVLFQAKHTIVKNTDGSLQNLTTLDADLWKTLSNWATFIKTGNTNSDFLNKHSFILVTNKSENNNDFINSLSLFKVDENIDKALEKVIELENKTKDETLKKYLKNVSSLGKRKLKSFLLKLTIETDVDEIIEKIKNRIFENIRQENLIDAVFEKLSSNLQLAKYTDIKERNKFEISFRDFNDKFGKCFKAAYENKPLPKREFPILLPDDLESQIFIKQLLDIGEIQSGSKEIRIYTTQMLKALNNFSYWVDENFVLPTDMDEFKKNSIQIWVNEFKSKYRQIERQVNSGSLIEDLENDIKNLGVDLIDCLRKQDLFIPSYPSLGIEHSNGHYYALSDKLEIGWHFDWESKYKV
ncbi:ABC-three component system protein [Flavobacterium soyangense]|uniref:CD-NTase associated protein 4-like DNA endonuclease domain-containing protein n=1 Tax=Flavobacterium soyangense TaxID=2023265 RepID=A0A930U8K6_9FLAO|nr:ABC-three component system protein [Flavobacterium soyangense]MBF2707437.1 hypothetical protein [Flavobacterium soyangense]